MQDTFICTETSKRLSLRKIKPELKNVWLDEVSLTVESASKETVIINWMRRDMVNEKQK